MIKIGYISPVNPEIDKIKWSGTYYSTFNAIKEIDNVNVEWIEYKEINFLTKLDYKIYQFKHSFKVDFSNDYFHSFQSGRLKVRSINQDLDSFDLIFVPGQVDVLAALSTKTPIAYYTDGTVPLMRDYYWFNMRDDVYREAFHVEKVALKKATYRIGASDWVANSFMKDYGIGKNIFVMPFGAGIDDGTIVRNQVSENDEPLNILFSGVDWERKGGSIAVKAVQKLVNAGINCQLNICGIRELPDWVKKLSFVKSYGFLNKNNSNDLNEYLSLWKKADIFILPTRAECAGIVFSEAAAFGVPVVTTDTGGIGNYVVNEETGVRLPLSARPDDYSEVILTWLKDKKLEQLSKNARSHYQLESSWKAWNRKFSGLISKI